MSVPCISRRIFSVSLLSAVAGCASKREMPIVTPSPMTRSGFISEPPTTPSSHASTLVESDGQLYAAWFGGTAERNPDVCIWLTRWTPTGWAPAKLVVDGIEPDGTRYPTWNPVLVKPRGMPLHLFYKVGSRPDHWWSYVITSSDGGNTWSNKRRLPENHIGPVRNKPIELADGTLLCGGSTEDAGWRVHMERVRLEHWTWSRTEALNTREQWDAIQPTILEWAPDRIQILCRSKQKVVLESWSSDQGRTWTPLTPTDLPNPNSAIDAVLLKDGRAVLIYNPSPDSRSVLAMAISSDGKKWRQVMELDRGVGEYSYPAVVQTSDGLVQVTYTWRRLRIKHTTIDPSKVI